MAGQTRLERDSMGELEVPADALWGAQTQRAVNNFPISGLTMPRPFIRAMGMIKRAAARAKYAEYFELITANPDVFPGFFHVDLASNVLPKLQLLRQFGFYPEPEPTEANTESCGAHSPRVEPQELATRAT